MYRSFYIPENKLDEFKKFIRTKTLSARFKHNPIKEGDEYFIALNIEVSDSNILNDLFNKWNDEVIEEQKLNSNKSSFWVKIFSKIFNNL